MDKPLHDTKGRVHCFCHAVPGKWHLAGVTLSAAGSLRWYFDEFGPSKEINKNFPDIKGYDLLDKQAERAPAGSDGLIFLPYLSGERTPYADPNARGVFFWYFLFAWSRSFREIDNGRSSIKPAELS